MEDFRFSEEEAKKATQDFLESVEEEGCWIAICKLCDTSCGCRLAGYPPTADCKRYIACPGCGAKGEQIEWKFEK